MKQTITISQKDFKNNFDQILLDNPTIHKILSKESNLGFTTQLVLDQLKAELTEKLFAGEETEDETPIAEETVSDAETDTESGSDDKENVSDVESDNEAPSNPEDEDPIEDDDLDELD